MSEMSPPQLALRPRDAAKSLGMSERTLWTLTSRGEIPHVKLNRATLYPVESLKQWLQAKASQPGKEDN